jgi:hypothetical protein
MNFLGELLQDGIELTSRSHLKNTYHMISIFLDSVFPTIVSYLWDTHFSRINGNFVIISDVKTLEQSLPRASKSYVWHILMKPIIPFDHRPSENKCRNMQLY